MRIKTNKLDYRPGEQVAITASEIEEGSLLQFQVLNYGADSLKGTADDFFYKSWLAGDGMQNDSDAAAGVLGTSWRVPGTALDSILEVQARAAGGDGMFGTGDDDVASAVFADAKPGGTGSTTSVRLDQWADGPVSEGDVDSTGNNNEVFVNGNLNAQKAHFNEGDAIPYRAVLDDLATGVVYGLVIQWDTVDSGAYALDYLTGYNFSFDGTKHVGEPDVTPIVGVGDVSSGAITAATIPSDSQLLDGFGAQFGVTDGLSSGQPSGQQAVTLFGAVSNASVGPVTYNADLTKASVTVFFTYTGGTANNADAVVIAWGGHIASSLDWVDDAGETVETASDISGSPYHMRVLSLLENGTPKSIGNQDRSLSADAVLPPIPPDAGTVMVTVDDDDTTDGVGDTLSPGDDDAAVSSTTLPVTDATSVDFLSLDGDAVLDTSSTAVKSGGVALFYFWDAASSTLYGSTDITDATTAAASAVFSVVIDNSAPGVFDYLFTQLGPVDQVDDGNNDENDLNIDLVYTATGLGGADTGTIAVTLDDDIPVRAANPAAVTATVEEDGMSSAVAPEASGLNGNDQSEGNRAAAGDGVGQDEATGAAGSLGTLVDVGADQPGVFSLSDVTSSLPTLYSKGDAVSYAVTDSADADTVKDTLTATAGGRTVFTLKVNPDGGWAFDLDDQLDHVDDDLNTENLLLRTSLNGSTSVAAIDFSSIVEVTDFDGDTVKPLLAGDFSVAVEDDIPVVTSITNLVGFNTGAPLTGLYNAPIGSDEPGSAGTDDGVVLQTLAGVAPSGRAIFNVSLTHDSATASSFEFDYFTSPTTNASLHATGTVTFNSDGSYVVDLDGPLLGGTTFSTSGGISRNYDTIGNNSPEITVKEYTSTFFGVLTGQSASPPSDTGDLQTDNSDLTFANGDTLKSAANSYVNVSTLTVGVDSDTVQAGELLSYDFFTANPVSGPTSPPAQPGALVNTSTPMAFVDAVDITLNQINLGHEDIAILLKLYNGTTFTTRLLLANSTSDYQAIAGSSDVLVSVTPDDYPAGYQIYGIQVLTSTEGLQGTAFALSDGAAVTLGTTGNDLADSGDNDVMKIIRIEVHIDQPGDADLQFTGKVVDADGDEASGLNFNVHLEGTSQVLSGSAGADQFVLAAGDTGITLATAATIDGFNSASDSIATSKVAADATIADGSALASFAAFVTAANAVLTDGTGTDAIYVAYNAAGSGNAWAVVDENNSGSVDTGDTLVVLTGINTAGEIVATGFT